jgi:hypothetical protein
MYPKLITRLEMLQANGIAPRNPEPLKPREHTFVTPETSSGKRKHCKVKEEVGSEGEYEDEERKREKALLVRFRLYVVNY